MIEVQYNHIGGRLCMLPLSISQSSVNSTSAVETVTTIIYNQYQIPVVCNLMEYPIEMEDNHLVIRDRQGNNNYFVAIKVGEQINRDEEQSIQKLVGLSDKIVCIELEQELESIIEKLYITVMPELFVRYSDAGSFITRPSLCFINDTYRKGYSREIEGIYYYKTVEQYTATQPPRDPGHMTDNIYNRQDDGVKSDDMLGITLGDLMNLYDNPELCEKDVAQIKYSMLSYKQSLCANKRRQKAEQHLFREGLRDFNKAVMRDIGKQHLIKKNLAKLEWKYEKLKNFGELLYEQNVNRELVRKYKSCTLFEVQQDSIILQIKQFYRVWIRNTLKDLKMAFNVIANRRDIKAVGQFRQKCQKCTEIINNCILHCQTQTKNYSLLLSMQDEVQEFITAHQNIIKDEYLSALKYLGYTLKYRWRNDAKIYHKAGFFMLILLLASMQNNIIIGITLISVGLIFLAINI